MWSITALRWQWLTYRDNKKRKQMDYHIDRHSPFFDIINNKMCRQDRRIIDRRLREWGLRLSSGAETFAWLDNEAINATWRFKRSDFVHLCATIHITKILCLALVVPSSKKEESQISVKIKDDPIFRRFISVKLTVSSSTFLFHFNSSWVSSERKFKQFLVFSDIRNKLHIKLHHVFHDNCTTSRKVHDRRPVLHAKYDASWSNRSSI